MTKLLVIGQPAAADPNAIQELVANKVANGRMIVARCGRPDELPAIVEGVSRAEGPIDTLELFDHGGPGVLKMGSATLFRSDARPDTRLEGFEIARRIAPFLTSNAQIRLVGCHTAGLAADEREALVLGQEGRYLLLKLALELGAHRIVSGTIQATDDDNFDRSGFIGDTAYLYSSLAALDYPPPDETRRDNSIAELLKDYCAMTPDSIGCKRMAATSRRRRSESRS